MDTGFRRSGYLPGLLGLRAVAAVSVVIHHFGAQYFPSWTGGYFAGGAYLVDVFFVLSGFLLGYAYIDRTGLTTTRRRFFLSRMARLYPAYLLGLVLSFSYFLTLLPAQGSEIARAAKTAVVAGSTLVMLQAWIPNAQSWNNPAWSLSNETFFYLVLTLVAGPVIVRFSRKQQIALAIAVTAGGTAILMMFHPGFHLEWVPLLRVGPFLIAVVVGSAFRNWRGPAWGRIPTSLAQLGAFLLVLLTASLFEPDNPLVHVVVSLVGLVCIVTLALGGGVLSFLFDTTVGRTLGDASYGIYIYQVGVFYTLAMLLGHRPNGWLEFALFMAILIAFSILSAKYFEPRGRALLERLLKTSRRQASPASVQADDLSLRAVQPN